MFYLLPHIVEESAALYPHKDAFRYKKSAITFEVLALQTNQLARLLLETGLNKGDRVGIYMNRCLETAIAIYGIMKAGGVYVPLNPSTPASQISFVINDCGIRHIITEPVSAKKLDVADTGVTHIIGYQSDWPVNMISWEEVKTMPSDYKDVNMLGQDLAYMMYTSGTTGTPKGIMHTHYSGLSYANLSAELYSLNDQDIVGSHASIHFDVSTFSYFTAPLAGATTVIVPDAHTKMPVSLAKLIEEENISVWYSVVLPLLQILQSGVIDEINFSALRWVLFCGEPFPVKHLKSLMEKWPQATFSNVYGPAEVNQCTFHHLSSPEEVDSSVPLGKAWNNTELLVLDEDGNTVDKEGVGELLVRSETMMRGYWNKPELTEKSLYTRTQNSRLEEVFYKTGDLVEIRNNNLYFLGRKDRQVKIRGYRVELDGVEATISEHPDVEEVAVFASAKGQTATIDAIIIPKDGADCLEKSIMQFVQSRLPAYSIPEHFFFSEKIPRTNAGKIDYKEIARSM